MQLEHGQRRVGNPRQGLSGGGVAQHQREGQRGDVFNPLAQRTQRQREDIEPVIEVGAEPAFGHFGRQIAVGTGDHPHVNLDRLGRADRNHFPLLQCAQQLGLERERHFGDLVEQQGPAIGGAKEAFAGLAGSGEGALAVPEQQRLEHGFGHRRAVDRNEGSGLARAAGVDEAAQHFLAGPGRAVDQDRDLACRQPVGQGQDRQRLRIGGDRHAGRGQRGQQRGQRRFGRRIAIGQGKVPAALLAAQSVGAAAFEQHAGAGARRNRLALAAQRCSRMARSRSQDRRRTVHQRGMAPCHRFACRQSAHRKPPSH